MKKFLAVLAAIVGFGVAASPAQAYIHESYHCPTGPWFTSNGYYASGPPTMSRPFHAWQHAKANLTGGNPGGVAQIARVSFQRTNSSFIRCNYNLWLINGHIYQYRYAVQGYSDTSFWFNWDFVRVR